MRITLFGAGASFGSGSVLPEAPPLGGDLYAELRKHLPSWNNLPVDIDTEFKKSFEDGMQILWDKYSAGIPELMRHMTLYFAQFRLRDSNSLYQKFIKELSSHFEKNNHLIGSLNYEILLEEAALSNNLKVNYFGDTTTSDSLSIWKLHGSCNFIPDGIQAGSGIMFGAGIVFDTGFKPVTPNDAIAFCLGGTALYPVMALYMKSKPLQIGQSVIKKQQELWSKKVLEAEKVLIVGVRPYFADECIWKPLTQTKAKVAYIGSKQEYDDWIKSDRRNETEFIASRWDQGFQQSIDFIRG